MATEEYPEIRTGGSLILAWRSKEKNVLIVGGGNVAAGRIVSVLEADAKVIVVCPENGIDMVLTAIDDPIESRKIYELCQAKKIPVNIADVPPLCDFYFMSQHRDGPLQVAVSTNGQCPKLANIIRRQIADTLPKGTKDAITKMGELRQKLRKIDPEHSSSSKRMDWISKICEQWTLDELNEMNERTMDTLLSFYELDQVPQYNSLLNIFEKNVKEQNDQISNETAGDNIENNKKQHEKRESMESIEIIQQADNKREPKKKGRIILVGAGPGDPLLLTLKASLVLAKADLVLSDRLIPPAMLSCASCEIRLAASKAGAEKAQDSQEQLLAWGLEALKEGKVVVRLKIGDPFIFGRGGEEVAFFKKNGWDVEVIPGISSAFSAPLSANVPLTQRGVADQILITTGQGTKGRMPELPNYHHTRTAVFLMAVGKANELSKILLEKGYPTDLPAVFVENGSRSNERIIYATVATLGKAVEINKIISPSTLIIGRTVDVLQDKKIVNNTIPCQEQTDILIDF
ncbi:5562_t:CDS:2 [Ambispora gerdemannii]|uniref:precorrin-2 dehydrogenase n=1 Tax=Ambispora gerdemannii TaxID=144530 RepID=A0A9N8Z1T0_9GLOM|nr:5562_t:CDS:2 [Ambispora gerdemannii]